MRKDVHMLRLLLRSQRLYNSAAIRASVAPCLEQWVGIAIPRVCTEWGLCMEIGGRGGVTLADGCRIVVSDNTLTINNASVLDTGMYQCFVQSDTNTVQASWALRLREPGGWSFTCFHGEVSIHSYSLCPCVFIHTHAQLPQQSLQYRVSMGLHWPWTAEFLKESCLSQRVKTPPSRLSSRLTPAPL